MLDNKKALEELEALDFTGKGEAYVEQRFLTSLLALLGYESHKDYEVIRHGDDGSSFKLRYPPVEKGKKRARHYNPDYIPTIRKKMFWIIEAKSPKDESYPFDPGSLVQGLQYCVHPEIQAKYLLVSNGSVSAIYDAHDSIFFEKDIYEPMLEFKSHELTKYWNDVFNLLSVEKLRNRIEVDLKIIYDKLCLSSLDESYPARLLKQVGASSNNNAKQIEHNVAKLAVEEMARQNTEWRKSVEQLDVLQVFRQMELPLHNGVAESQIFVEKSLASGISPMQILNNLIQDFEQQSIFRKEQSFVGVCELYQRIEDASVRQACIAFFQHNQEGHLPLLNQLECALLRLTRKIAIISLYPEARKRIAKELETAPEMVRFVHTPTALEEIFPFELMTHIQTFNKIKVLLNDQQSQLLSYVVEIESTLKNDFESARSRLSNSEKQIGGFEFYGIGGKHYAFKNILHNFKIEVS